MKTMEKDIIKSTKKFAKANNIPFNNAVESMVLNAIRETAFQIRESITISFDDFITQQYGKKGTVKRKKHDTKLDKIQKEMVKKEKIKKNDKPNKALKDAAVRYKKNLTK